MEPLPRPKECRSIVSGGAPSGTDKMLGFPRVAVAVVAVAVGEMRLTELRIDEQTWASGSPERRREWRLAVSEVVQEGRFELPDGVSGPLTALLAIITTGPGAGARARFDVAA